MVPRFNPIIVDRERRPILDSKGNPLTVPHDMSRWFVLELGGTDASAAYAHLRATRVFDNVYLNALYQPCATPNDPLFAPQQWGLNNTGQYCGATGFDIRALPAWEQLGATPSYPCSVGVMDTGLCLWPGTGSIGHEDLYAWTNGLNAVFPDSLPIDHDTEWNHGTSCAGLIGMKGNNGIGGAAPAWDITVVPVKVSNPIGFVESAVVYGLEWLRNHGVKIANMSFGIRDYMGGPVPEALQNARAAGMALVASAGNANYEGDRVYPAAYRHNVIAVNAFLTDGQVWDDNNVCCDILPDSMKASQWGDYVDVTAPGGRGIMTTRSMRPGQYYWGLSGVDSDTCKPNWGQCYTDFGGTSAATALVSGVLGAILSKNDMLDGADAEQIMLRTAVHHPQYGSDCNIQSGCGHPNLAAALGRVTPSKTVEHGIVSGYGSTYDGHGHALLRFFPWSPEGEGNYTFERYVFETTVDLDSEFAAPPDAWGRSLGSMGFRRFEDGDTVDYYQEEPKYTEVVQVTSTTITLRSYAYHMHASADPQWFWFPDGAAPVFSYTAIEAGSGTGVGDVENEAGLRVAPNPAQTSARLDFGDVRALAHVEVFDAGGRRVTDVDLDQRGSGRWDLRDAAGHRVAAGAYFLRCREGRGDRRSRLLVVR